MNNVLLVTVTKVEAQAVLEVFNSDVGQPIKRRWVGDKGYSELGEVGNVTPILVQSEMGSVGPGGSLLTVSKAILAVKPRAVIMVGVCFGADRMKQQAGDILVSRQVWPYELQKVGRGRPIIPRGDRVAASPMLLDRCRNADLDWKGARVQFGLLLSGEKLINRSAKRNELLRLEPEAIGGEMEGAGLYAAASDAKTDWIIVKGVCDWADGEKSDNHQPLAARNAAQFVRHVIGQGGLAEDNRNITRVSLIVEGNYESFTEGERIRIVGVLAELLDLSRDRIRVLSVTSGSVQLNLELPANAAGRLYAMALASDPGLQKAGIKAIKINSEMVTVLPRQATSLASSVLPPDPAANAILGASGRLRRIRVGIVDDSQLVIDAFRYRLEQVPALEIAFMVRSGKELESTLAQVTVDVLVLDMSARIATNKDDPYPIPAALHRLQNRFPKLNAIITSLSVDKVLVQSILSAGANGLVIKSDIEAYERLGEIITMVADGGVYLSQTALKLLRRPDPNAGFSALTKRQVELLALCAAYPESNLGELAERMGATPSTVRNLMSQIYLRLNVRNRRDAVLQAKLSGQV